MATRWEKTGTQCLKRDRNTGLLYFHGRVCGKSFTRCLGTTKVGVAKNLMEDLRRDLRTELSGQGLAVHFLSEAIAIYKRDIKPLTPDKRRWCGQVADYLLEHLGDRDVRSYTKQEFKDWKTRLCTEPNPQSGRMWGPATIRDALQISKRIFQICQDEEWIQVSRVASIKPPRQDAKEPQPTPTL